MHNVLKELFNDLCSRMQQTDELLTQQIKTYVASDLNTNPPPGGRVLNANNLVRQINRGDSMTIKMFQLALRIVGYTRYRFDLRLDVASTRKRYVIREECVFVNKVRRFVVKRYVSDVEKDPLYGDMNILKSLFSKYMSLRGVTPAEIKTFINNHCAKRASRDLRVSKGNIPMQLTRNDYTYYIFLEALAIFGHESYELDLSVYHERSNKWITIKGKSGASLTDQIDQQLITELDEDNQDN